jgi:hypothetical protein
MICAGNAGESVFIHVAVPARIIALVDTALRLKNLAPVMAKPRKVEEPAAKYAAPAKSPAKPAPSSATGVRYARSEDVAKIADKIFAERKELLRKLAQ